MLTHTPKHTGCSVSCSLNHKQPPTNKQLIPGHDWRLQNPSAPGTSRRRAWNFSFKNIIRKKIGKNHTRAHTHKKACLGTALWYSRVACWLWEKCCEKHSRFTDAIQRSNKTVHFHQAAKWLTFMFMGAVCYLWPLKACCLWVLVSEGLQREWRWTEADHVVTFTAPLSLTRAKTAELRMEQCLSLHLSLQSA